MTTFARLLSASSRRQRGWIAIGALLGFLAVGSNVALMAISAYLISKAALVSNVAEVALAITAVRVLAIGRAAFRYLERYVTHRARSPSWPTCASGSSPRSSRSRRRAWRTVASGDLLARIVADIETLEDFYVRVVVPPVVAGLVRGLRQAAAGGLRPGPRAGPARLPRR